MVLGTPYGARRLYRNALNFCQASARGCPRGSDQRHRSAMRRLPVAADGRYVRRVPKETLVGRMIAGYAIRSEVGEGGTSAVFRAEHPTHGVVAVKVLREKLRQDKTAVARFVREARYGERV